MIHLFSEKSEIRTLQFFDKYRDKVTLLCAPSFIAQLYYAEKLYLAKDKPFDLPVTSLNVETFKLLKQEDTAPTDRLYIVADNEGESHRLAQLQGMYPNLRFIGLGRHLFPALVAGNHHVVFEEIPESLQVKAITLVIATPRSGSSLLADMLTDLGAGNIKEHLRGDVVEILKSGYNFDFKSALQNFINFASVRRRFGTKLISHFLVDYLTKSDSLQDVVGVCSGVKTNVIFLDREDTAAQTISGYMASKRGLWHITSAADAEKIQSAPLPALDFQAALGRYFLYLQQKSVLNSLRPMFPRALSLTYEDDLLAVDPVQVAPRLMQFVGIDTLPTVMEKTSRRQRIANDGTQVVVDEFKRELSKMFAGGSA